MNENEMISQVFFIVDDSIDLLRTGPAEWQENLILSHAPTQVSEPLAIQSQQCTIDGKQKKDSSKLIDSVGNNCPWEVIPEKWDVSG